MHCLCAQISYSYSYLCMLPFAEVQIVMWVSSCSVVFQMELTVLV